MPLHGLTDGTYVFPATAQRDAGDDILQARRGADTIDAGFGLNEVHGANKIHTAPSARRRKAGTQNDTLSL